MKKWQRQHLFFISLLFGIFILSGLLAVRYNRTWDLTFNQRNQLNETSILIVKQLKSPVHVSAFSHGNPKVKALISRLLTRYKNHGDINWTFKNPDAEIDLVRQYGITRDGELLMTYQGQSVLVNTLNETAISRGLYRLLQGKTRHALFLSGHGEHDSNTNNDDSNNYNSYSQFKQRLQQADIIMNHVDLAVTKRIPDNTDVLVLAAPKHAYSETEVQAIAEYLKKGGRLLWLANQKNSEQPALSRLLGVRFEKGVLIGQSGKAYGLKDPAYVPIIPTTQKNQSPALSGIETILVFPEAAPISILPTDNAKAWLAEPLLSPQGDWYLKRDNNITKATSPINIGMSLTAKSMTERAKVWLIGDADFAANRFIGQGQNSDFAVSIVAQLAAPDVKHIIINNEMPPPVVISEYSLAVLALAMLVVVPLLILLIGFIVRRRTEV